MAMQAVPRDGRVPLARVTHLLAVAHELATDGVYWLEERMRHGRDMAEPSQATHRPEAATEC